MVNIHILKILKNAAVRKDNESGPNFQAMSYCRATRTEAYSELCLKIELKIELFPKIVNGLKNSLLLRKVPA